MTRLEQLAPRFLVTPWVGMPATTTPAQMQDQRRTMGISFECPCGTEHKSGFRLVVVFHNPLDGGAPPSGAFPLMAYAILHEDTWAGLSVEPFDAGVHGRWRIDRGVVLRAE